MTQESPIRLSSSADTHAVFNIGSERENINTFTTDHALQQALASFAPSLDTSALSAFGARTGTADYLRLGYQANENKPTFNTHDRFGNRIDRVDYHPAYHQLMRTAIEEGIHSIPWLDEQPHANVYRAVKAYLHNQVEAGHGCPITMTFACVPTLRKQPSVAEHWLPKILSNHYDPRDIPMQEKQGLTIGMAMTEKQGGSDVRANTTRAYPASSAGPGQPYELTGHKFFMSAPMCDAFLVLAYAPGGLSCFLVPRWRPDGTKNQLFIQRLKNKMGNVSNASSEVEYRGALGWLIGEEGRGVANILEMVALTRFDCMIGSAAAMRQAVAQATYHCAQREAFGKRLIEQPLMQNVLADLIIESDAALTLAMRAATALDMAATSEHDARFLRIATAIGKYWICKRTPEHAYEAMECIGGSGVMEDSMMPRLYREAPINTIWEGSGNVQCLDVLRAMERSPETVDALFSELKATAGCDTRLDQYVAELKQDLSDRNDIAYRARHLVEQMALSLQASLLLQHGDSQVAEAFIASRLSTNKGLVYGNLPRGIHCHSLIQRALGNGI